MTVGKLSTDELLTAVLTELRTNPGFAERLAAELPAEAIKTIKGGVKKASKPKTTERAKPAKTKKTPPEEPVSLKSLLIREGEEALHTFLKTLKRKDQLLAIIQRQQIPVDANALAGRPDALRHAVIEGVKFRIAERLAAAS